MLSRDLSSSKMKNFVCLQVSSTVFKSDIRQFACNQSVFLVLLLITKSDLF